MKNILVLAHDDKGQEARLQVALDITRAIEGHLTCLDVAMNPLLGDEYVSSYAGAQLALEEKKNEAANRTRIEAHVIGVGQLARAAAEAKLALAQIAEDAKDFDRAAALLQGMGSAEKGAYPPDGALLLLGNLRERQGKTDDAKKAYDDLLTRFPQSAFADEAAKARAKVTSARRIFRGERSMPSARSAGADIS